MEPTPAPLARIGYSERWQALFAPHAEAGLIPARVIRADRGSVMVACADGVVRAEPSARLRREARGAEELPATGDWVALDPAPTHEAALVEAVLPRLSAFTRGASGTTSVVQVIAANVDTVFVVHVAVEPNLRRIERELALAWESGATPVVVLTKADLAQDPDASRSEVEAVALGVDVLVTSAKTGEGVEALTRYADDGRTVALIGPSGAGKSTLINALLGEERQVTREVRATDGKGRHATVARELIPLPSGGALLDTPGLREVAMVEADEGIAAVFPDIQALAAGCRFRDCTHAGEPGCAVAAAVGRGELASERLENLHKLRREAEVAAMKADARLRAEEARKWKIIHKSVKGLYKRRERDGKR